MMECPIQKGNPEVLLDYCSRKLSGESVRIFERHIAVCGDCHRFAQGQAMVWDALDSWEAVPVSAAFDRNLYARIDAHEQSSLWKRMFGHPIFGWRPAMSAAGACVALFAALLIYSPGTVPKTQMETVELEQVEQTLEDLDMLKQLSVPSGAQEL